MCVKQLREQVKCGIKNLFQIVSYVPPPLFPPGRKALAFYRGSNFAGLDEELSEIVAARKVKASTTTSQEGEQAGIMVRWFQFQSLLSDK